MANNRLDKINNELKKAISEVINYKLSDELNNCIISVLEVKTTLNLEFCDVYISIFTSKNEDCSVVFNKLSSKMSFVRAEVAKKIKLRTMPKLLLHLDKSEEYSAHINSLIKKINNPNK